MFFREFVMCFIIKIGIFQEAISDSNDRRLSCTIVFVRKLMCVSKCQMHENMPCQQLINLSFLVQVVSAFSNLTLRLRLKWEENKEERKSWEKN